MPNKLIEDKLVLERVKWVLKKSLNQANNKCTGYILEEVNPELADESMIVILRFKPLSLSKTNYTYFMHKVAVSSTFGNDKCSA